MGFESHVREWEELAEDPLSAVLTDNRNWNIDEFFSTADIDFKNLLRNIEEFGLPEGRLRALDFGCGVGRITRQLATYFQDCWGVDISEQMLKLAGEHNPSSHFLLNRNKNLHAFPNDHFDLVYSMLVLQHQPSKRLVETYIGEMIRVLRPGGLLAFQLPSQLPLRYWFAPRRRMYKLFHAVGIRHTLLHRWKLSPMKMSAMPPKRVALVVKAAGGQLLTTEPHAVGGPIPSVMYYCAKPKSR